MDTGLLRPSPAGAGRLPERGTSLVEVCLTLGVAGMLTLVGLGGHLDARRLELDAAQQELQATLDHAFVLARAQGTNITLGLATGRDPNHLPIHLGRHLAWGKPANVPLPPGMDAPVRAALTGEAHPDITVTPRHTATASLWFLHDGRDVLCMRLSSRGRVRLLRWHGEARRWARVG